MRLENRVAIVPGAQQGIGEAIAVAFAREGAAVVVNYLDDAARAGTIVAGIEAAGGRAIAIQGDVAAPEGVQAMIEAAAALGGVDLLVNNAGIFPRADLLTLERP